MIFIDSRSGSKELAEYIEGAILTTLPFGDIYFQGNGPDGEIQIGIERKRIGDLIQSISSGRLSGHQLPGLLEEYGRVYLLVEGAWITDRHTGIIKVYRYGKFKPLGESRFSTKRLLGYLVSLNAQTGVSVLTALDVRETAILIQELYQWWSQPWEKHTALLQVNRLTQPSAFLRPGKPPLIREIAITLPGIGYDRVRAVEEAFGTVGRMWEATEEEWREVEGIGKITAKRAWEALHT